MTLGIFLEVIVILMTLDIVLEGIVVLMTNTLLHPLKNSQPPALPEERREVMALILLWCSHRVKPFLFPINPFVACGDLFHKWRVCTTKR